jgi:hypothetical protein
MTLDRFLSKKKSSGANVNEPQLSTSGFPFQWTVISLLLLLLIDYYTIFLCINKKHSIIEIKYTCFIIIYQYDLLKQALKMFILGQFWGSGTD